MVDHLQEDVHRSYADIVPLFIRDLSISYFGIWGRRGPEASSSRIPKHSYIPI
jgi:hypothetical protein